MAKQFTTEDVSNADSLYPRIYADRSELEYAPLPWQERGLTETSSCYGRRLNTGLKIHFCGRAYRLYATCFSNVSSVWFTVKGKRIYVS